MLLVRGGITCSSLLGINTIGLAVYISCKNIQNSYFDMLNSLWFISRNALPCEFDKLRLRHQIKKNKLRAYPVPAESTQRMSDNLKLEYPLS